MSKKAIIAIAIVVVVIAGTLLMGVFGGGGGRQRAMGAVQVKAMNVLVQDTPLTLEYAGSVKGKDEVKVQARVSGNVTDKYIKGGQYVSAGQALYKIDDRNYRAALLQAQANLAQAQATYNNALIDLQRNEQLLAAAAVSEQVVTTQRAQVAAYQANVDAMAALVQQAQQNLDDTVVYAPMSGKLAVDDVAVGTYAAAGNTTLVTIGSSNPIFVQFSISEGEYLKYVGASVVPGQALPSKSVRITLSDGSEYPAEGSIVEVDRAMQDNSGSLIVKAQFDNPDGVLVPGMFARAKLTGDTLKGAILVPERAVQQLLGKSFVMIVGEDGKSKAQNVELGSKIGSYCIVEKGLTGKEQVIVEGLTSLTEGMDLAITEVKPEDMGFSLTASNL
ncbi:MAG: efflux RND transporter periplasmic adaptor subunit [Anaerovibrio slackiae]|uniref:efflux RND transporter periplasmic adaptor subunit n=2 Tax=Anaerovibrio slackiae TaxID=2652309 RepID=UPI0023F27969|nr:efflux RND transporter periplasmic adaptor subunit [Anaerovibrio slackiae]MDD6163346.1 efflux RND transporter periplasmic adaptor subunit [Anaerovibrio slackiae]